MHIWQIEKGPGDAAWDAFVAAHPRGHFLQSGAWARHRANDGWFARRCLVRDGEGSGTILAGAQILIHGRPGLRRAYCPRGPVCEPGDPTWPALAAAMARATRGCVALRLEPHWPDEPATRGFLIQAGLREAAAIQPPSTLVLSLGRGEEALLAEMKQKWRYNLRLAERKGVTVRREGADALPTLEALIADTAARNGIGDRPAGYHASVWRAFEAASPGAARLYVARFEGLALAASLVVHFGRCATYLYGGSSERERQRMPNHALQWAAIREAESAGLAQYDFWGIPDALGVATVAGEALDAVPVRGDGLWGVWGFKRGFGGQVWRAVGAWDQVHAPLRYTLGSRLIPALRARAVGARR